VNLISAFAPVLRDKARSARATRARRVAGGTPSEATGEGRTSRVRTASRGRIANYAFSKREGRGYFARCPNIILIP
jgi:hypothetical protein